MGEGFKIVIRFARVFLKLNSDTRAMGRFSDFFSAVFSVLRHRVEKIHKP